MPRLIAFLRAINVGGHTVTMAQLRKEFEALGFEDVETFIASGNVIFTRAHRPSGGVGEEDRGQAARSRSATRSRRSCAPSASWRRSPRYRPFPEAQIEDAGAVCVGFLHQPRSTPATTRALMAFTTDIDDFHTHGREVYWLCKKRQSESTFSIRQHGAEAENTRHVPRHQHRDTAGRRSTVHHDQDAHARHHHDSRTARAVVAGQTEPRCVRRSASRSTSGARTVILNMQEVPRSIRPASPRWPRVT